MHVGCNVASLASSVDPERGFLRRLHQGGVVAKLFPTVAELKLQVGMEWKRLRMLKKKQAGKLKLRKVERCE